MLTEYFEELKSIKIRLSEILDEELKRRTSLGFASPEDVKLNLVLEETRVGGSPEAVNGKPTVHLNILQEISQDPKKRTTYESELAQIDNWIINTRNLVAPHRLNIIDNTLIDYLLNPNKFDSIDIRSLPDGKGDYYKNLLPRLKEGAYFINRYLERIFSEVQDTPLNHLRRTLKHELEHSNPDYKPVIDNLNAKENDFIQEFGRYQEGSRHLPNGDIKRKVYDYLTRAALLSPSDEVRAYFYQCFNQDSDTVDIVKQRRESIRDILMNKFLPNEYRQLILGIVAKQFMMGSLNEGREFDRNTLSYVTNTFFQGSRADSNLSVKQEEVDIKLADSMLKELGYWVLKFEEGIKKALDEWQGVYLEKVKAK